MLLRRRSSGDPVIKLSFRWRALCLPWTIVRVYINNDLEPVFVTFFYIHCDCDINLDQYSCCICELLEYFLLSPAQ